MSSLNFASILENATSEAAAFAAGLAIGPTLAPLVRQLENDAWNVVQSKTLEPGAVAEAQAQGYTGSNADAQEAAWTGLDSERLAVLAYVASKAPGTSELLELWRRGRITQDLVTAGLKKAGLRDEYITPVLDLFDNPLDPAVIATAIQRGIMTDPGFLPVGPPTGTGNVPAFPVSPLDPIEEAQWSGISKERLFVETALVGLPLALVQAAQAYFRGIITADDFKRAVSEGNTRNEWGDAALEVSRQILTAGQYAELQLRGYLTEAQRRAQTARHGMTDADSDLLYNVLGRGLNVHQAFIGIRRGGVFEGPTDQIPAWALYMLERGNLRPEVYNLAWAAHETYPSYFVIRALAQAGVITAERTRQLFEGLGWPLDVADAAATFYAPGTAKAADPHVTKAQTKAWTEAQNSYIAQESTPQDVAPIFTLLGVASDAQPEILATWDAIRALRRKQLSPAQVKKAYAEGVANPATGQPWSLTDATDALLARGYSPDDAATLLAE